MSIIKSGTTNTTAYSVDANTNGDLVFIVSESLTAMTINASGAVSFSSGGGFDIASANITNLTATTATVSASTYLASASGSVGIGTSSPAYKLDVNGGVSINDKSLISANAYFICGSNGFRWNNNTDGFNNVIMNDNGTTGFRNAIGLGLGDLTTVTTSGVGVQFPATQSASSNANTLDDYEEGTWTPTYTTDGIDFTSVTYDAVTGGRYTKTGNQVFVEGVLRTDAITVGGATGNVLIGGLPFATNSGTFRGVVNIAFAAGFAGDMPISGQFRNSNTTAYLSYRTSVNGGSFDLVVADLGTGANANTLVFSGTYTV